MKSGWNRHSIYRVDFIPHILNWLRLKLNGFGLGMGRSSESSFYCLRYFRASLTFFFSNAFQFIYLFIWTCIFLYCFSFLSTDYIKLRLSTFVQNRSIHIYINFLIFTEYFKLRVDSQRLSDAQIINWVMAIWYLFYINICSASL